MTSFRETTTDAAAAAVLLNEYFDQRAETFPGGADAYRRVLPRPSDFLPPSGTFVIVEDAATDIGCGGIRQLSPAADGRVRYEVKHLYLRPETRGRGTGRALLEELERRALTLGAQQLVLDTNASQVAAGALYHRAGYTQVEPYNDNANATHWYRKNLD